ncbi:[acyl-carrier-protein] S-malonyltransferase [Hydrogenoanaerobacterium saccharovorans]|uniref:Malonyl CoA-acyl carrier protein transacylase n=1 Tax=Hydrogenoanaerobacterium saccharovorans TaxID=474960 RepID=A0A1H8CQ41_9FIRM|nr:ACP S-malonyltransferase [Hydrogenoanaerobacterium saccharovorans]RPF43259.1 [acyl-carrier-protein] S-malonyltransferase [Hydrogenoanaerobacterium saccharovorans]SEM97273.1 [acyl-carrier-protein] S-malonyltransferase [Hydrogenoanaerobacterium saccharovorans]
MNNIAFLFSGTGSQSVGMGKEMYAQYPEFRRIYECASDMFGFDVPKMSFEGTMEEISGTAISHRLIYAMSMGVYEVVKTRLPQPAAFAGHSLGEMAALTACGVFSLEQGFTALKWRSQYMEETGRSLNGAMYAILGCDAAAVEAACAKTGGFVLAVNYNSPAQTVISGDASAAAAAAELLQAQGAKAIQLGVKVPFHTEKLKDAADRMRESLLTLDYNHTPSARFFCNVTGSESTDFSNLPDYLAKQMVSPVRFVDELNAMQAAGISTYLELGPSKVLTGLVKKTIKGCTAANIDSPKALEKAFELL